MIAVRFRAMREDDLDQVMVVERLAYPFPWSRGIFADCLKVGYTCVIGTSDSTPVAHAVMSVVAGEAHILNLCVTTKLRGHRLGRRLLDYVLGLVRVARVESVFLEVRPSNPAALALYHSRGFNEVGTRPDYYPANNGREDAVIMAKTLFAGELRQAMGFQGSDSGPRRG